MKCIQITKAALEVNVLFLRLATFPVREIREYQRMESQDKVIEGQNLQDLDWKIICALIVLLGLQVINVR